MCNYFIVHNFIELFHIIQTDDISTKILRKITEKLWADEHF